MSRRQEIETRLKDVLDCVAQLHRRESNARAQARKARDELEQLTGPATRSAELGVVSFHGRATTSIPLTLEPQCIRVPSCETPMALWSMPLTASQRARPAIALEIEPSEAGARPRRERSVESIRLQPFRPHRLVTLESAAEHRHVRIARSEGPFAILKLELVPSGSAREAELAAAAADAEPDVDAGRDGASGIRPIPAPPAAVGMHTAAELDQQLWGGYAACALPLLERLKFDFSAAVKERVNAAWSLTRWYFAAQDHGAALAQLRYAKSLQLASMPRFVLAEAQCLMHVGCCDEALELLRREAVPAKAADFLLLESTAIRQSTLLRSEDIEQAESLQLDCINRVLRAADLAPIVKKRSAERLSLANIEAPAQPRGVSQSRKVSIVVPAFNAATTIEWTLVSLLAQTWKNIEVIVVDDASEDPTAQRVADISDRDSRVRLVRLDSNKGSYFARNAGARLATGDLLMVHDADDWSHPQHIERLIEMLDAYPNALGVKSHWVRVNEQLEMLGTWLPRDSVLELNFSSLMFSRELLETLGGWDEVRVAGDAEFYSRFRAAFGEQSIVTTPRNCPLAFSLTRKDSLTRHSATHLKSMYHGIRRNYMDAYRWWHGRLDRQRDLPIATTGATSSSRRPFPRPIGNAPKAADVNRFDLIVIADYACPDAALDHALSALVAGARDGRRVAALHWRHFELSNRAPLCSEFYRTCIEHDVAILSAGDSANAALVLISSAPLLARIVSPCAAIAANDVAVLVDAGAEPAGVSWSERGSPYDVRHNLVELFGTEGVWLPTSEAAARAMREDRRYPPAPPAAWQRMVDGTLLGSAPMRWRGGDRERPVIGRRLVGALDWPSRRSELDRVYGADAAWDVRFHADESALRTLLHNAPRHWQAVPRDSIGGVEFCSDLDFYIEFPHELHADAPGQGLLDAMALGIPVVVPHRYRPLLGDAASYAAPEAVAATIERLWSSESGYLERAAAGRAFALERFGMEDFIGRLLSACAAERTVVPFGLNTGVRSVS